MEKRKVILRKFAWKGQDYELTLAAAARLVEKSPTFLNRMMAEHKMTFQEAIEAEPNDPRYRKSRRIAPGSNSRENTREKREERFMEKNKDLINRVISRGLTRGIY